MTPAAPTPAPLPNAIQPNGAALLAVPDTLVEQIAERAADLLADRVANWQQADTGYLNVGGAAEFLSCSASRIYGLVSARRIPFHKDGSRVLFDRGELRDYVAKGGAKCP